MAMTVEVRAARGADDVELVRELFARYAAGLDVDLSYQGFDRECAGLPQPYVAPLGSLLLAWLVGNPESTADATDKRVCGCVAVRPLGKRIAELKRLFVDDSARGLGVGRLLSEAALRFAAEAGFEAIRLDTLPGMSSAQGLYARLGFYEIAPYYDTPIAGTRFLERRLADYRSRGGNADG